ncbi:MAG: DUF445 domain-containing protein [Planctomycetota bacterium]
MPASLTLTTWILLPLIGGLIGLGTNYIAVRMIFRPLRPRRFLFVRFHGLVPRRQKDLARKIGKVVGSHLVEHQDIVRGLGKLDFDALLGSVLDKGLTPKIQELRTLPLIGGFLTEERIQDVRQSIQKSILAHRQTILEEIENGLEKGLDVPGLVEQKVAAFPVEQLERLILDVASRELRAITLLGGVLGALIGLLQVGVLWYLA